MAQTKQVKPATKPTKRTRSKPGAPVTPALPPMTKRDRLQARLEEAGGASLAQLAKAFGWHAREL